MPVPSAGIPPTPARLPRLTPQSLATASDCPRRLWLNHHLPGAAAAPPDHILMLRERADAHERAIAARFEDREGPLWRRDGSFSDAAAETLNCCANSPEFRGLQTRTSRNSLTTRSASK